MRAGQHVVNVGMRLTRHDFRFFVHPHREIMELARSGGLQAVYDRSSGPWRSLIFKRISDV